MNQERQGRAAACSWLAASAAALTSGTAVCADGVVVESTSERYQASDRIANGAEVTLENDAYVIVMDPSGNAHRFSGASSIYRDASTDGGGRGGISERVFGAAGQVVIGAGESERIGATRGENFCDDEELPVGKSIACGQGSADARLEVWLLDDDTLLQPGAPVRYMLDASVDLRVMCELGDADGRWSPAGGDMAHGPMLVHGGVRVAVPRRGAVDAAMPMPGDAATLRCYGLDPQTWDLLGPRLSPNAEADDIFAVSAVYAETRQSVFLRTSIAFEMAASDAP